MPLDTGADSGVSEKPAALQMARWSSWASSIKPATPPRRIDLSDLTVTAPFSSRTAVVLAHPDSNARTVGSGIPFKAFSVVQRMCDQNHAPIRQPDDPFGNMVQPDAQCGACASARNHGRNPV
ncbi:MAG: hypothetical protein OXH76_18355 [Boseongicola sp.]|nr:hypothetical protein [Boseongicola sp.]